MFWLLFTVAIAINTNDLFSPVHKMAKHFNKHVSHSRRRLQDSTTVPFSQINCQNDDEGTQEQWTSAQCDGTYMYMAMSSSQSACQSGNWDMRASMKMGVCADFSGDGTFGTITCDSSGMTLSLGGCTTGLDMMGLMGTIAMKPDKIDDWKCKTEADDKTGYYNKISCSGTNVVFSMYETAGCSASSELSTGAITTNCMKMEDSTDIDCPVTGGNKDPPSSSSSSSENPMMMAMSMKCQDGYVIANFCKDTAYAVDLSTNPFNAAVYFNFKKDKCIKEGMSDCKDTVSSQQPAFKFSKGTGDKCNYDKFAGEASSTCAADKKNTGESFEVTGGSTCSNVETIDGHVVVFSVDCSGDMVRIEPCEMNDSNGNQINLDTATGVVAENNEVVVKSSDGSTVSTTTVKIQDSTASSDSFKDGGNSDPINGGSSSAALMAFIAVFAAMFNL